MIDTRIEQIKLWSEHRGLDKGNSVAQALKTCEETGELAAAVLRKDIDGVVDAVGDVVVTLVVLCQQLGLELDACVTAAYKEIKDRDGRMVDGVFVKAEDLQ